MQGNIKNKKLPISLVMVVYHEEKIIERALRSCFNLVDEIIIVHDGKCNDNTLNIAKKYTDKIFENQHFGHSEIHRPFAYMQTKNEWIIQLDADEYLSPELQDNLGDLINDQYGAYDISWSTFHFDQHYYWHYKRILFKKNKTYFIGAIHESIKPIDKNVKIKKIKSALMHEPAYDNTTWQVFQKKWKKLAMIQARELLGDFLALPKWNCQFSDWEKSKKVRIRHPLIIGVLGTSIYNSFFILKDFLKHRKFFLLKQGIFSLAYHFYLYIYIFKLKNEKR